MEHYIALIKKNFIYQLKFIRLILTRGITVYIAHNIEFQLSLKHSILENKQLQCPWA